MKNGEKCPGESCQGGQMVQVGTKFVCDHCRMEVHQKVNLKRVTEVFAQIEKEGQVQNASESDAYEMVEQFNLLPNEAKLLKHLVDSKVYNVYESAIEIKGEPISHEISGKYNLIEAIVLFQLLGEALIDRLHCGETGEACGTCNVGAAHGLGILDQAFQAGADAKKNEIDDELREV